MIIFDNVLLTGAAGGLGTVLRPALRGLAKRLRCTDVKPLADEGFGHEELVEADLSDPAVAERLVGGMDAVVHFGGISTEADWEQVSKVNINGTFHLYEAARRGGIKRIVFASSNHAIGFYEQTQTIDASVPHRPDTLYGLSKAFTEDLASLYWDKYRLESVHLRIGSSFPEPRDLRMLTTWLSYRDLIQLVTRCLTAPRVGNMVVYGASANLAGFWDNRGASILGFHPQDSSEHYRDELAKADPHPDKDASAMRYQGGAYTSFDIKLRASD